MQSPAWRQAMRDWDEWLGVQNIYDPQQVQAIKRRLAAKVERMSPLELSKFLQDFQAKLEILKGDEARDFNQWWTATSAAASDEYAKRLRSGLPDVVSLSAHELQATLDGFEERRAQTRQASEAFQHWREQRVKVVQSELQQQHKAS